MSDDHVDGVDFGGSSGLTRIWRLLRGSRWLALVQSLLSLAEGVLEATILTIFARVALTAVKETPSTVGIPLLGDHSTTAALVSLGVLIVLRLMTGSLVAITRGHLQFRMVTAIRTQVLGSYSRASWRSQADLDDGGLQQLLVNLPNNASSALAGLLNHLGNFLVMVAMLVYALLADVTLTLALVASIVLASAAFLPLRRWVRSRSARVLERQRLLSTAAVELSSMKFEVQACGLGERISQSLYGLIAWEGRLGRQVTTVKSMVVPLYTTMTYSAVAVGLVMLQTSSVDNIDEVGPILLVVLRSLSYGQGIQHAAIAVATLTPVLDFLRDNLALLDSQRIHWGAEPLEVIEHIELTEVSYSYAESDGPALYGISAKVSQGERLGIVGPSGSGKSTLVRLILGLVSPDTGSVLVNHSPIFGHDREMWSRRIGVVPQSAQVLRGSISENLRMYRDGISDNDLWWALEVADLATDVQAMPHALDTQIGAGARALSGGQQQRLAIARAFATRPDLVVMDEPTSSIDAMSEAAVSAAIERLPGDVIIVIVSHRMRILRGCDRLLVVEGGQITADGPSQQVLDSSPYLVAALKA